MSGTRPSEVRIASLVPSLTELVVALGLGDRLVARTGWCIHPAAALARVPKVGGTKTVNLAKLRRLAPTHGLVITDVARTLPKVNEGLLYGSSVAERGTNDASFGKTVPEETVG